ncbi:MAG TPA: extracellular solute-binding protein, partial [Roseiflexaceae bacterium]|nr:extracellular solute-binding protein [Roseiflexaceae bacterium]
MSRRAMLRALAGGISALGIAPLIGACGQGAPEAESSVPTVDVPQSPAATSTPQNTITVWYYSTSINQTIEAFKRANPAIGVDVKLFYDADQGLLRTLESGTGLPDVCIFSSGFAGALLQRGGMAPLSEAPFDAAALKGDFVAAAWNGALNEQGKLLGLPLSVYPGTFWYRADLLAEAGVESDPAALKERITDWPGLFAFAKEYTANRATSSLL